MYRRKSFFSNTEASQPVNQWLCIAFISLVCFWVVLIYVVDKTEAYGQNYVDIREVLLK